ncbi:hypothetical protein BT93_F1864 [Corymbia citriodora subsp. variegata]|nr:hypothetical protein BT93_F1864 [Corymbia citriodora subsp. variegata]
MRYLHDKSGRLLVSCFRRKVEVPKLDCNVTFVE